MVTNDFVLPTWIKRAMGETFFPPFDFTFLIVSIVIEPFCSTEPSTKRAANSVPCKKLLG
jgi:hypothetical protein